MTERTLVLLGAAHVHLPDHLARIAAHGWRISHVHDRDGARCERFRAETGAQPVADLSRLRDTGCAGAVICSETAYHEADIGIALRAGLPVFSEKPLAGNAGAALRMADLAERRGLPLMTGYFLRTNDGLRRLRDAVRAGEIGALTHAGMRFAHDGGFAGWLDLDSWMTDPELACYGGFADEAVHVLDTLQWLAGPIEDARAMTGNVLGYPLDDHGAAVLRFEGGAVGVAEAGWTDSAMRLELDLQGTLGAARVEDGRLEIRHRSEKSPTLSADLGPLDAGAGIVPFLDTLESRPAKGAVPPGEAATVNALLDGMGLRLA